MFSGTVQWANSILSPSMRERFAWKPEIPNFRWAMHIDRSVGMSPSHVATTPWLFRIARAMQPVLPRAVSRSKQRSDTPASPYLFTSVFMAQ